MQKITFKEFENAIYLYLTNVLSDPSLSSNILGEWKVLSLPNAAIQPTEIKINYITYMIENEELQDNWYSLNQEYDSSIDKVIPVFTSIFNVKITCYGNGYRDKEELILENKAFSVARCLKYALLLTDDRNKDLFKYGNIGLYDFPSSISNTPGTFLQSVSDISEFSFSLVSNVDVFGSFTTLLPSIEIETVPIDITVSPQDEYPDVTLHVEPTTKE